MKTYKKYDDKNELIDYIVTLDDVTVTIIKHDFGNFEKYAFSYGQASCKFGKIIHDEPNIYINNIILEVCDNKNYDMELLIKVDNRFYYYIPYGNRDGIRYTLGMFH